MAADHDDAGASEMRNRAGQPPRVYLDVMLGTLTRILRMAGWDAAYALDRDVEADDTILDEATSEDRLLLTRDRQLAGRAPASLLLTTRDVDDQLRELRTAGFTIELDEPHRCSKCNGRLRRVDADETTPAYAPSPGETRVWRCVECGQCFWKGSHWDAVAARLTADETPDESGRRQ